MNTTASSVVAATSSVVAATDPTALLNTQLSSALSTLGDAQFWEETISPATVRTELSTTDPSNPNSTPTLQRGMKWLLASISKGRDVSDFYPHVVKLVGATSLEVRKMVFMYLVQYADHDATTRELSLLSINSFQRGLADHEQLIRGLALRVLSSIRIQDILQIQILGVQKCAKDSSPYVRKCAANALSKLSPRCDIEQRQMLLEIMKNLLEVETSTMVLTSVLVAFGELCPERLEFMHKSFRKICHLLTDMDEWGQVVVIDILARYCRVFFKEPRAWKHGTAEKIDRERRVSRRAPKQSLVQAFSDDTAEQLEQVESQLQQGLPSGSPKKIRRRVVRKGFYSDDEDTSSEEEVYEGPFGNAKSIASTMRQPPILPNVDPPIHVSADAKEDIDLDEDHRLLLDSSMPLLNSRNAGVVLSVCSLHYYCGVSSVKARSAIGRALVRIHRDRREIQFVVLKDIQILANDCPSAFAPFLPDFFVKALDPPFTRLIKIDILTSLALERAAIETVLKEMRMYIRSADTKFVCASIRAVGKVVELSRIVYDREGLKSGHVIDSRREANRIALDCLHGLAVTTENSDNHVVVGEAISVMQNILMIVISDSSGLSSNLDIVDPNGIQGLVLRRSLVLLLKSLSRRSVENLSKSNPEDSDDDKDRDETTFGDNFDITLPAKDAATAIWLIGEWMTNIQLSPLEVRGLDGDGKSRARFEVGRVMAGFFPRLEEPEKQQAIHFATKVILSAALGTIVPLLGEIAICEHILAMGRVDVNPDIKDRSRFESSLIHVSIGLKLDTSAMEMIPSFINSLSLQQAQKVMLDRRLAPSFLQVKDLSNSDRVKFRFGTLSSLVGHKARDAYIPLPPWGQKNSSKSLRDHSEVALKAPEEKEPKPSNNDNAPASGFYDSDATSTQSSSESSSSDSSSSDWSGSDDESTGSASDAHGLSNNPATIPRERKLGIGQHPMETLVAQQRSMESLFSINNQDENSESGESDSSSSESSSDEPSKNMNLNTSDNELSTQIDLLHMGNQSSTMNHPSQNLPRTASSAIDDLRGLVMPPIAVPESGDETSTERDTSSWLQLVRPELCGGLAARARFLRGKTREREVKLAGLDPNSSAVVCVQIQFKNKKNDGGSLRRVKILPRAGSKGGIAMKRTICPPEIPELKKGQMSTAQVCTQFVTASNRGGDMVIRLDIKSSSGGGVPVEIKPNVGELLRPYSMNVSEFDSTLSKMHGFQRVSARFAVNPATIDALITSVFKEAALNPVGPAKFDGGRFRVVAQLPASDDLVLGLIECERLTGTGKVTTCCDNAVAANSILRTLKQAVTRLE